MKCAKIIVKSNYEKRGDLVLRSYVRALKKINAIKFIDGDNAIIYGFLDDSGVFHEIFTNEVIDYDNYVSVLAEEIYHIINLPKELKDLIKKVNEKVLFDKTIDLGFEISTMEELAKDRAVELDAYDNCLSRINPYMRLSDDNQHKYNAYNSLKIKTEEIKKMGKSDHSSNIDEYDVKDYYSKPESELEEEYLVFELPKKLVKRK